MRRDHPSAFVLGAPIAPVPSLGCAEYAKGHAADAQHTESDIFHCVIHERRIDRVNTASDDREMTGRNVLCTGARLRICDVDYSVLNLHISELFAVLISVA